MEDESETEEINVSLTALRNYFQNSNEKEETPNLANSQRGKSEDKQKNVPNEEDVSYNQNLSKKQILDYR